MPNLRYKICQSTSGCFPLFTALTLAISNISDDSVNIKQSVSKGSYLLLGSPSLDKDQTTDIRVQSVSIYIIILDPDERPTTVRSNDTLVDTPFQLISDFFHVNQGVLCC